MQHTYHSKDDLDRQATQYEAEEDDSVGLLDLMDILKGLHSKEDFERNVYEEVDVVRLDQPYE